MTPRSNNVRRRGRVFLLPILAGAGLGLLGVVALGHLPDRRESVDSGSAVNSPKPVQIAAAGASAAQGEIGFGGNDLRILAEEPASAPSPDSADAPVADAADDARPAPSEDGVLELTWEDLMPPGEQEKVDQEYLDYFAQLERRTRAGLGRAQSLFDYGQTLDDIGIAAEMGGIAEGSSLDQMVQFGTFNTIPELDGKTVRIPGYIVPFDYRPDDRYEAFLFAPYFGACIHSPPPPPNQIIYVTIDEPMTIRDIYPAVWLQGVLTTERNENDLGNAAYTLRLSSLALYEENDR